MWKSENWLEWIVQLLFLLSLCATLSNAFITNHRISYVRLPSLSPSLSVTSPITSFTRHQNIYISIQTTTNIRYTKSSFLCQSNNDDNPPEPLAGEVVSDEKAYDVFADLRVKLKGTCIYLVGMMGSGKTSVGAELASQLGYRFLDTDSIAEYMIEMPIADFFAQGPEKEQEFRQVEYQVLMELSQYMRVVVSTGGGCVIKNENWGQLRHGLIIFLDLSPEHIFARLSANPSEMQKRPLLSQANPLARLQELYASRLDKYMQADLRVSVNPGASSKQVAVDVAGTVLEFMAANPPMWVEWKRKRDAVAIETAARMNPAATIKADVGFAPAAVKGTITTVNLSDIKSGKVKLPNSGASEAAEDSDRSPKKGFQK